MLRDLPSEKSATSMNSSYQSWSTQLQSEAIHELAELIAYRNCRAKEIESRFAEQEAQIRSEFAARMAEAQEKHETATTHLNREYTLKLEEARREFDGGTDQLAADRDALVAKAKSRQAEALANGENIWRQTRQISLQNFESEHRHAIETHLQAQANAVTCREQCDWLSAQAIELLKRRGRRWNEAPPPPTDPDIGTAQLLDRYSQSAKKVHQGMQQLSRLLPVRFVDEGWPILTFFIVLIVLGGSLGYLAHWQGWQWPAISLGVAVALAFGGRVVAETLGRRQGKALLDQITTELLEARIAAAHTQEMVDVEDRRRHRQLNKKKDQQIRQADEAWHQISEDVRQECTTAIQQATTAYNVQTESFERIWNDRAESCRRIYPPQIQTEKERFVRETAELERERDNKLAHCQALRDSEWRELTEQWHLGADKFARFAEEQRTVREQEFPAFPTVDWNTWKPLKTEIRGVPLGEFDVKLSDFPDGPATDPRLAIPWGNQRLPTWLSFPVSPSLVLKAELDGRSQAIGILQNAMLRFLTSFPPGSVRFTIFDPTGLGQNFSAFMHLADYDEHLVGSRIWTEANHINQRLLDLTEHMENVIQKYLRNDFRSIQEYNRRAGEIAEPFQVLVMANFPANISDESARRLSSIATSGARCGVYYLLSCDMRMALPKEFDLRDLEAHANTLVWEDRKFVWQNPALRGFPLTLDNPPSSEIAKTVIRAAGSHARDAIRVEVPFAAIAPTRTEWWNGSSADELRIPLGRAGATQLQYLTLGKGTSQHVLIAGKTGSGKSTLLNAFITNVALTYSPREVQFMLVDFKKGVEFKAYAEQQLPHAQVIAIESEREFGMSVLQRLDQELHDRGERFRAAGVQGLAAFRGARPMEPLPRLVLIVDEFQEFFVKDDKISQEASLLLDRLVRQGRAFGIHVVLGSQTLAGAYTLARSTLGQMAVRIALQCSESDAHLILSEDNTAARLLRRPGEAIYNNANGLLEGNNLFQVVWLPDAEREGYLRELHGFAELKGETTPKPIVFEGNAGADIRENADLMSMAAVPPPITAASTRVTAYLGAPIAIKSATSVTLTRQSGRHILLVGQNEEMAAAIFGSSLISAALSQPLKSPEDSQRAAQIVLLDGGGESLGHGVAAELKRLNVLEVDSVEPLGVTYAIESLAQEVQRRVKEASLTEPPILLAIYNLGRYRELRRTEDDYGLGSFSSAGADDSPMVPSSRRLAEILRDGPLVGVHAILWCDTYNNLMRWFDRQVLRDITFRVLFQMTPTDSSNLMDSAAASQLGPHRAVLYDDNRGEAERFRPYAWPLVATAFRDMA
jgi:DNA segregation ATPase FtsK/SpoIIIE, S-DNA-T family